MGTGMASGVSAGLGGVAVSTSNFSINCKVGEMVLDVRKANGLWEQVGHMGLCTNLRTDTSLS